MTGRSPMVPLGEVLTKAEEWIALKPEERYREVTVRLWGKGVVQRREVTGAEIAAKKRLVVRSQQFIVSRIDARNGAFGLVPDSLDGAVVSNDFPVFIPNPTRVLPSFLGWMSKTRGFVDLCKAASEGTTNRVRLKEDRFLATKIPLPPLQDQRRIVARIEDLAAKIEEARRLQRQIESGARRLLLAVFNDFINGAERRPIRDVAPIIRRPVTGDPQESYPELGIRSFGKGTFHKAALSYIEVGSKRLYRIEPGDLVFNNVFAWEGAVAVARSEDSGRFGSHRFITCVAKSGVVTAQFLCFYFLTDEGLQQLGEASPGGAGRNRTLGLNALEEIKVPVPPYERQLWFDKLQARVKTALEVQAETATELDALLPSVLDKAFRGEL